MFLEAVVVVVLEKTFFSLLCDHVGLENVPAEREKKLFRLVQQDFSAKSGCILKPFSPSRIARRSLKDGAGIQRQKVNIYYYYLPLPHPKGSSSSKPLQVRFGGKTDFSRHLAAESKLKNIPAKETKNDLACSSFRRCENEKWGTWKSQVCVCVRAP